MNILPYSNFQKSSVILTKMAEVFLLEKSILVIRLLDTNFEIDAEETKHQIEAALKLTEGTDMPVLIDVRESFHSLSEEAKDLAAEQTNKLAEAILVKYIHQRLLATFFLKISHYKNKHPVKIFTDETQAIIWLKQFVENKNS